MRRPPSSAFPFQAMILRLLSFIPSVPVLVRGLTVGFHRYRFTSALPNAVVHEELCESTLAWEIPSKLLKLQAEVLIDEVARLTGKAGEMETIVAAASPTPQTSAELL